MRVRELCAGESYGNLTVMFRDFEYEDSLRSAGRPVRPYYRCRCSCGNDTTIIVYDIIRGNTRSCGCLRNKAHVEAGKKRRAELAGTIVNDLLVLGIDESKRTGGAGGGKHAYWICRCLKCGESRSFRSSDLTGGIAKDCGCGKAERRKNGRLKDLSGVVFGNLSVIGRDYIDGEKSGHHARWLCRCGLCGGVESVSSAMLTQYGKDRCRRCAKMPAGEEKIYDLLVGAGISFVHNRKFADCKFDETGGALRFDFIVKDFDNQNIYMIEYDGIQHFKKVPHWESKIDYEGRIKRDEAKNSWCSEHNIPLIRIPYTRLNKLNMDDITPSKTKFLI